MARIESLLSARLFLRPRQVGDRLYFLSNLSGRLSLYAMDEEGSVPEPLLPADIALQNPTLIGGEPYAVFPELDKILVMIDRDGDENYQPMLIPLDGGFPEPAFGDAFNGWRVHMLKSDSERNIVYLNAESRSQSLRVAWRGRLDAGTLEKLGESKWDAFIAGVNADHTKAVLLDSYTLGDDVLYLWREGEGLSLLYGKPLEERAEGEKVPLNAIHACHFTPGDRGLLFLTALHEDTYGLGYLDLRDPREVKPVEVVGAVHRGRGEMESLEHLKDDRYLVGFNIDGVSWMYEGTFDEEALRMHLRTVIVGEAPLDQGVLDSIHYDRKRDRYVLSFSSATSPTQIYTVQGEKRDQVVQHTRERPLGLDPKLLSPGEDASFESFDGLRISARLYLPAEELGYEGPRPLVYYIHGGPQSQERPEDRKSVV